MNFSFYIFDSNNGNYNQFPSDERSALFKDYTENCKDKTQLTVYRQQQLIFYTYIQEYDDAKNCLHNEIKN